MTNPALHELSSPVDRLKSRHDGHRRRPIPKSRHNDLRGGSTTTTTRPSPQRSPEVAPRRPRGFSISTYAGSSGLSSATANRVTRPIRRIVANAAETRHTTSQQQGGTWVHQQRTPGAPSRAARRGAGRGHMYRQGAPRPCVALVPAHQGHCEDLATAARVGRTLPGGLAPVGGRSEPCDTLPPRI